MSHTKQRMERIQELKIFLTKGQTFKILAMKEVRNSIEAYSGRGKESWVEWLNHILELDHVEGGDLRHTLESK